MLRARWPTGVCVWDYDNNGNGASLLLMNNHDGTFREEGMERGCGLNDDGVEQAGMGVGVGDCNLHGHLVVQGHFTDDTNLEALHSSRGCTFGDFDNDGDLDILIINLNEPPSLLPNNLTGDSRWIKVKLIGTSSNRSAIGACVLARYGEKQQLQEVINQSSYCSTNDRGGISAPCVPGSAARAWIASM